MSIYKLLISKTHS